MPIFDFLKRKPRSDEIVSVDDVYFWQVQEGQPERTLMQTLVHTSTFQEMVREAYLMRVRYPGSSSQPVALCLVAEERDHQVIVDSVGAVFRRQFSTSESLDIMFLSERQRNRARSVGPPFFTNTRVG